MVNLSPAVRPSLFELIFSRRRAAFAALGCLLLSITAHAEQLQRLGPVEVHYSLLPTTFLKPAIAEQYGVTRGPDRALLNISVLDARVQPISRAVAALLNGTMTNLLGQTQSLEFRETREGDAIYYLAELKHSDREVLRFDIEVIVDGVVLGHLAFQQQMFLEED